jgi:glutamate transport system substrate-binding protein
VHRTRRTGAIVGLLVLALALASAGCSSSPAKATSILTGTVNVGFVDDAPGFSEGTHNPVGFDIDLKNFLATKLGVQTAPVQLTYADRPGALKSKEVTLVIATYTITTERNQSGIDFAGPYMVSPQALLVRVDDNRFAKKDDADDKSICTVGTTTGNDTPVSKVKGQVTATTQDCVTLLGAHNTDAVFTDELILYGYVRANPGKFKIVLPGVFGELQYQGIGMLGGHHGDCLTINKMVTEYLNTQWAQDFRTNFPTVVADFPGTNPADGNFESKFKPSANDMSLLSCKLP